jgi:membrane fusion protein, multidrug efflux system
VDKDNVVQQRTVQAGQREGNLRVISSGITDDDLVVVSGNQKAIPGQKVAPEVTKIVAEGGPSPPGKS